MAGEVVGNDSVHWRFVHDDRGNGQPRPTPMKGAKGGSIQAGDEVEMRGNAEVRGRDGVPFADIGRKTGLTPGCFRVTVRFSRQQWPNLVDLQKELHGQIAAMTTSVQDDQYELQFDVPAIHRERNKVNPANPPAEIHVDW